MPMKGLRDGPNTTAWYAVAHSIAMMVAWGLLAAFSIYMAERRSHRWFPVHWIAGVLNLALTVLGTIFIAVYFEWNFFPLDREDSSQQALLIACYSHGPLLLHIQDAPLAWVLCDYHGWVAGKSILVSVGGLLMMRGPYKGLLGLVIHLVYDPKRTRATNLELIHQFLGRATYVSALINIFTGSQYLQKDVDKTNVLAVYQFLPAIAQLVVACNVAFFAWNTQKVRRGGSYLLVNEVRSEGLSLDARSE
jgi:hypothetical protein